MSKTNYMDAHLPLAAQMEGLLFFLTKPVSIPELAEMLSTTHENIQSSLVDLRQSLETRGITLIQEQENISLRVHPSLAPVIEKLIKRERSAPLSTAALETLAIILYQEKTTKADIDYIRGVNAQFMLRNLLIRGLIQKVPNAQNKRSPWYVATSECLATMGVTDRAHLPEYTSIQESLADAAEASDQDNF
jgi:segregation and condensation protein B